MITADANFVLLLRSATREAHQHVLTIWGYSVIDQVAETVFPKSGVPTTTMSTLHASNILIVGGTSGIGFAIAKQLLDHHVETLIVASSTKAKVDDAVSKLTSIVSSKDGSGVKIVGEVVDAGNSQSVRDLLARIGEIDHLVWTAGDKSLPRDFRSTNVDNAKSWHLFLRNVLLILTRLLPSTDVFDVRFWGVVVAAQEAKFKAGGSLILTTGGLI